MSHSETIVWEPGWMPRGTWSAGLRRARPRPGPELDGAVVISENHLKRAAFDRHSHGANPSMKVFLSYARPDRGIARKIVNGLHNSGHEIWFDEFELTPGTAWGRDIDNALKACRAMIVLISLASMDSKEVRREIDHALLSRNFAHRVLPVYLAPTDDVPWFLRTQKGIHVGKNLSKAISRVKTALDHFSEQLEPVAREKLLMARRHRDLCPNVFVSHSSRDRAFVERVVAVLRRHGIASWYAPTGILGTQQWQDEIGRAPAMQRVPPGLVEERVELEVGQARAGLRPRG